LLVRRTGWLDASGGTSPPATARRFRRTHDGGNGKTLTEGRAEIEKCAFNCDYFAENAERFLRRRSIDIGGPKTFVTYNPLGRHHGGHAMEFSILAGVPVCRTNPYAGNAVVLKHASNVPGCALAIESVFRDAGFPENLFRTLLVPSRDVRALIEDPNIAAVTLTGSVDAGRQVAAAAGASSKRRCSNWEARTRIWCSPTPTSKGRQRSAR